MDRVFEDTYKESHCEQLRCRQFITEILEIAKLLVNATRCGLDNAMRKTRSFCDDKEEGDWLGREDRPTMWLHCGEEEAERETELGTTVHEQAYRDFHSIDYE